MRCWHRDRSRAWTLEGVTYVRCLQCGARREIDLRRMRYSGDWYWERPKVSAHADAVVRDLCDAPKNGGGKWYRALV